MNLDAIKARHEVRGPLAKVFVVSGAQVTDADLEFLAHAWHDIGTLIDEIERLDGLSRALHSRCNLLREKVACGEMMLKRISGYGVAKVAELHATRKRAEAAEAGILELRETMGRWLDVIHARDKTIH